MIRKLASSLLCLGSILMTATILLGFYVDEEIQQSSYFDKTRIGLIITSVVMIVTGLCLILHRLQPFFTPSATQVYPRLYVGNRKAAKSIEFLKSLGVDHVLNCAEGDWIVGSVNFNPEDLLELQDNGIVYKGIPCDDIEEEDISVHFRPCADFIQEALDDGGSVLVNCFRGVSRSATIVIAYLIIKERMSLEKAMDTVKKMRDIVHPSPGFMQKLQHLEKSLKRDLVEVKTIVQPLDVEIVDPSEMKASRCLPCHVSGANAKPVKEGGKCEEGSGMDSLFDTHGRHSEEGSAVDSLFVNEVTREAVRGSMTISRGPN